MKSDEPGQIDSILEQALSNYSKQEPSPGLEDRVIKYVFSAGTGPRFVFPGWALSAAAAALLLILVPIGWIYHHLTPAVSQPASGRRTDEGVSPQTRGSAPPSRDLGPSRAQRAPRKGADSAPDRTFHGALPAYVSELPKQRQFPAPSPLTDEERALLVLANSAPDEALRISMDQAQPGVAPIEVKEIDIKQLRIDGLQQGAGE